MQINDSSNARVMTDKRVQVIHIGISKFKVVKNIN